MQVWIENNYRLRPYDWSCNRDGYSIMGECKVVLALVHESILHMKVSVETLIRFTKAKVEYMSLGPWELFERIRRSVWLALSPKVRTPTRHRVYTLCILGIARARWEYGNLSNVCRLQKLFKYYSECDLGERELEISKYLRSHNVISVRLRKFGRMMASQPELLQMIRQKLRVLEEDNYEEAAKRLEDLKYHDVAKISIEQAWIKVTASLN